MGDFLDELFEQFDQEEQTRIRAAEASTEKILEQGTAAVRNRRLAAGSSDDSDWVLQPELDSRADSAGVVFVAYANALWRQTDAARDECIRDFLAKVENLVEPVLTRCEWEGEGLINALRRECQTTAWLIYSLLSTGTASTTSSMLDSVGGSARSEAEAGESSGVGDPVVYFKPQEVLQFWKPWRKRIRETADSDARSARFNGRTYSEARRQEELLKDARGWGLAELEKMAPAVPDVFQLRRRVVQRTWDEFVPRHRHSADFKLSYEEFSSALWEEGWPSLEDRAIDAILASHAGGTTLPSRSDLAQGVLSDHADLPESARDLIAAAELQAQCILEGFDQDSDYLRAQASILGVSPSDLDFAPGNAVLELAAGTRDQGRTQAAAHLFRITAVQYWKWLRPDVDRFLAELEIRWRQVCQKFQLDTTIPANVKRDWKAWALHERGAALGRAGGEQRERDEPPQTTPTLLGLPGATGPVQDATADAASDAPPVGDKKILKLNVALITTWMAEEGWTNETLAVRLKLSERAISSLRNNGEYHGAEAVTKLANLMGRDIPDLYLP